MKINRLGTIKKVIALTLCCLVLFSLTGCNKISWDELVGAFRVDYFYFDYDDLAENVDFAEIIEIIDRRYPMHAAYEIDESHVKIKKTFDYDTTLELLYEFSQIEYNDGPIFFSQLPEFLGDCIRVWYSDGSYEIYGCSTTSVAWAQCTSKDYDDLISKYME